MKFGNRREAGRILAHKIRSLGIEHPLVFALAPDGVPVAWEVARPLDAPLEALIVQEIRHPNQPQQILGAITEDEFSSVDPGTSKRPSELQPKELESAFLEGADELRRLVHLYRGARALPSLENRDVILVDAGAASDACLIAAAETLKRRGARSLTFATPARSLMSVEALEKDPMIDQIVAILKPQRISGVADIYEDATPVEEKEALALLRRAREYGIPEVAEQNVDIHDGAVRLAGTLSIPSECHGLVIFALGSGNGRLNHRNRRFAHFLNRAGLATFLFDLLTEKESLFQSNVFDVGLLAARLRLAVDQLRPRKDLAGLPFGFFGSSTGAAAAIVAASETLDVSAVVLRSGRPDLARDEASRVKAPVLLIVGSKDHPVLEANQSVLPLFPRGDLINLKGATHHFEEAGPTLAASQHAVDWFVRWFKRRGKSIETAA